MKKAMKKILRLSEKYKKGQPKKKYNRIHVLSDCEKKEEGRIVVLKPPKKRKRGRQKGSKLSAATKAKIARAMTGKKRSAVTKAKIALGNTGKMLSAVTKLKVAVAQIEIWGDPAKRAAQSSALKRHYKCVTKCSRRDIVAQLDTLRHEILASFENIGKCDQLLYTYVHEKQVKTKWVSVMTYEVRAVVGKKRQLNTAMKRLGLRKCVEGWNIGSKVFVKVV